MFIQKEVTTLFRSSAASKPKRKKQKEWRGERSFQIAACVSMVWCGDRERQLSFLRPSVYVHGFIWKQGFCSFILKNKTKKSHPHKQVLKILRPNENAKTQLKRCQEHAKPTTQTKNSTIAMHRLRSWCQRFQKTARLHQSSQITEKFVLKNLHPGRCFPKGPFQWPKMQFACEWKAKTHF